MSAMTREAAEAEAAKRERHKSKFLTDKRWAAVHTSVRGWHVALIHDHVQIERKAREKAQRALSMGDMAAFVEAAGDALLAKVGAAIDAMPRDSVRLPQGEDSRSEAECEASQSGGSDSERIAQNSVRTVSKDHP
jgi:hypothetical protein